MQRFERSPASLFEILQSKHPEPRGASPRPAARRPPMPRPAKALPRGAAWATAAALTLAGMSGLSLLWRSTETPVALPDAPALSSPLMGRAGGLIESSPSPPPLKDRQQDPLAHDVAREHQESRPFDRGGAQAPRSHD